MGGSFDVGTGPTAAAPPDPRLDVRFDRQGDEVAASVRRDGAVIEPERYLGARGHLVALRAGDVGYLHVHPLGGAGPPSGSRPPFQPQHLCPLLRLPGRRRGPHRRLHH